MARVFAASVVSAYLGIVFVSGTPSGWQHFGVPGQKPSFLDLRSVTTAWVCRRRGIDVLPSNPCDPQLRPANYPRIWLLPSRLGWGEGATVPLGIAIGVLFFVAALSLVPPSLPRAAAFSAFLCMPGVMLGVERGNVDLLMFCLVVAAVHLLARHSRRLESALLVLAAAILKLFPIFAAPFLLRERRRSTRTLFGVVVVAFVAYAAATFGDIREIVHAVPKSGRYSYGLDIFGHPLSRGVGAGNRFVWDAILAAVAIAAAIVINRYPIGVRRRISASRFELDAFVAGASVYILSYAFFRSFDYRLAFLLLTLPLLLREAGERRLIPLAALCASVGALCLESRRLLPEGVLAQYALFVLLLAILIQVAREAPSATGYRRGQRPLPELVPPLNGS